MKSRNPSRRTLALSSITAALLLSAGSLAAPAHAADPLVWAS